MNKTASTKESDEEIVKLIVVKTSEPLVTIIVYNYEYQANKDGAVKEDVEAQTNHVPT